MAIFVSILCKANILQIYFYSYATHFTAAYLMNKGILLLIISLQDWHLLYKGISVQGRGDLRIYPLF